MYILIRFYFQVIKIFDIMQELVCYSVGWLGFSSGGSGVGAVRGGAAGTLGPSEPSRLLLVFTVVLLSLLYFEL